jgi:DNA-binding MarR family transcriptional regulator
MGAEFTSLQHSRNLNVYDILSEIKGAADRASEALLDREQQTNSCVHTEYASANFVERLTQLQRSRRVELGHELFFDPAWDILLEIYLADLQGRKVNITKISDIADIPQTTGLRWIKVLTERGLALRSDDPLDRRRCFIIITDNGRDRMRRYISKLARLLNAF